MTFTPKEGMYCRRRDGIKVGPIRSTRQEDGFDSEWRWTTDELAETTSGAWRGDGSYDHIAAKAETPFDLVAEWVDEPPKALPVRTVTRTEIVPGQYGSVVIISSGDGFVDLELDWHRHAAPELRAAARVFTSLAEALEESE